MIWVQGHRVAMTISGRGVTGWWMLGAGLAVAWMPGAQAQSAWSQIAGAQTSTQRDGQGRIGSEQDHTAPFDYGFGRGVRVPDWQRSVWQRVLLSRMHAVMDPAAPTPFATEAAIQTMPRPLVAPPTNGGANAAIGGTFGPVLPWPIIPLHVALLPDGRVMNYGTDQNGKQGASMYYDVWDPTADYTSSHMVLPNTTATDIFCSGLGLLPNGNLLITGGDLTISGARNYSNPNATIFSPATNTIASDGVMNYPRWYPSDVPLANGDHFIVGGRSTQKPNVGVAVPEYYGVAANHFTPMTGANTGTKIGWYYPKAFVTSNGTLFVVDQSGSISNFGLDGTGSFTTLKQKADPGLYDVPTLMYSPGKLLSIRKNATLTTTDETYRFDQIDYSGASPVVTQLANVPGQGREWANMTVLADGRVFVNGGSGTDNVLSMVSYVSELYTPATNSWVQGPSAVEPRLYHSVALLLPDATVLTGGGGAPGPTNQLNAEIYYPPYLFNADGSGTFAARPVIAAAPAQVLPGTNFTLTMADAGVVGGVSLIRIAAVTHSTSLQSRFIPAAFSQNGTSLTVTAPSNTNDLMTGYWMVFVFNAAGVPSVAKIVQVPLPSAPMGRPAG